METIAVLVSLDKLAAPAMAIPTQVGLWTSSHDLFYKDANVMILGRVKPTDFFF